MSRKYDDLAGRLADRLTASPPRGRVTAASADEPDSTDAARRGSSHPGGADDRDDTSPPPQSSPRVQSAPATGDQAPATVRRSHLVPDDLHRRARRAKALGSTGERATWSDLLVEGVSRLVEHPRPDRLVASSPRPDEPKRLVQATLPVTLDRRFVECHLDLNDRPGERVTYEALWASAIELAIADT